METFVIICVWRMAYFSFVLIVTQNSSRCFLRAQRDINPVSHQHIEELHCSRNFDQIEVKVDSGLVEFWAVART